MTDTPVDPGAPNALGVFVQDKLKALNMRPTEFAELTGLGRTTVYELLDGRPPGKVSTQQLRKMGDILGVTMDTLVDLANGTVQEVQAQDATGELVRGFVLAHSDLPPEVLRQALVVADAAARMARPAPFVTEPVKASRRRR